MKKLIIGFAFLIAAQLLSSFVAKPIKPTASDTHFKSLGAEGVTGALLLSGFRGLSIDLLWIRAESAKKNGDFYESLSIFEVISKLQPRYEEVWEYMTWEMCYNITHEMDDKSSKESWFLAGITSGTKGCLQNPKSAKLLRHLAHTFKHKGKVYPKYIEKTNWSNLLNPIFEKHQIELLKKDTFTSPFLLSSKLYASSISLCETKDIYQPAFVARMLPITIQADAHFHRNNGRHFLAMKRYLKSIIEWKKLLIKSNKGIGIKRKYDIIKNQESYERGAGIAKRHLKRLINSLAKQKSLSNKCLELIEQKKYSKLKDEFKNEDSWLKTHKSKKILWLDEQ